ncbi:MAG: DUF445 family protein [Thermodesulfobacteriota bacterium]
MPFNPTYIAPPLLGAFIGYMTNYVAIKMLFRPLKPWRIFGLRLPMTPGVIPSKRHDLAQNIGDMVGDHLLTSSDIGRAIDSPEFQGELAELINSRMDNILAKDLGPLTEIIPRRFNSYFLATVKVLRWRFINQMHQFMEGEEFAAAVRATLNQQVDELLAAPLDKTVPPASLDHFYDFLEKSATELLRHQKLESWLREMLDDKLTGFMEQGKSPADLLPEQAIDAICNRLEEEAPAILSKLSDLIREPELQENIADSICKAVASFASGLGPLAGMLSSFISPDVIHDKVSSFLTDKGDEIGQWLANDTIQLRVSSIISDKTRAFLNTPFAEIMAGMDDDQLARLKEELISQLLIMVQNPKMASGLTTLMKEAFSRQSERPLQNILREVLGEESLDSGKEMLAAKVLTALRSNRVKKMIDQLVIDHVETKLINHPIGPLRDLLPKEVQESMGDYAREQVSELLVREVPDLVECLNIRELVTRKVDGLDLLKLEGLLMSIMEEQFKYINLFGALLGFLIGLLNLLVLGMA